MKLDNQLYLHKTFVMFFNKSARPIRNLIRGIVSIGVGITIIIVPGLTINLVIQFLGGLLILDGLINLIINMINKSKKQTIMFIVPRGTSNLIFGAILVLFPSFIVGIFVFLIGFILIIAGGSQLAAQLSGRKIMGLSWIISIFSLLALLAGIFMLTNPFKSAITLLIFFGVMIALYGVGEIVWSFKIRKYQKQNPPEQANVIDTEYEEVD
jgi:uncharacterized membrane protein HdeD (DUF308 family)